MELCHFVLMFCCLLTWWGWLLLNKVLCLTYFGTETDNPRVIATACIDTIHNFGLRYRTLCTLVVDFLQRIMPWSIRLLFGSSNVYDDKAQH